MEQDQQKNSYEIKKQEKLQEQELSQKKKTTKRFIKIFLIVIFVAVPVAGLVWYANTLLSLPESDIISKTGIHWHTTLAISINGKEQEIPANIGIGVVHQRIHTHNTSGEIHMEMGGLVTKKDTLLGGFFTIWGKQFNSTCILDACNGPDGTVKLLVNGNQNTEFENYHMQDKDKIEIKYE